jgi:hypothetical protein
MTKHYNVGDKVQVRKDLLFDMRIKDGKYDRWVGELAEYTGKWVTIKYFDERDDSYLINKDSIRPLKVSLSGKISLVNKTTNTT